MELRQKRKERSVFYDYKDRSDVFFGLERIGFWERDYEGGEEEGVRKDGGGEDRTL
jgi:hypothetical protein